MISHSTEPQGHPILVERRFKLIRVNSSFNIRIERVQKTDAGNYKCIVLSKAGKIERLVRLEVPSKSSIGSNFVELLSRKYSLANLAAKQNLAGNLFLVLQHSFSVLNNCVCLAAL